MRAVRSLASAAARDSTHARWRSRNACASASAAAQGAAARIARSSSPSASRRGIEAREPLLDAARAAYEGAPLVEHDDGLAQRLLRPVEVVGQGRPRRVRLGPGVVVAAIPGEERRQGQEVALRRATDEVLQLLRHVVVEVEQLVDLGEAEDGAAAVEGDVELNFDSGWPQGGVRLRVVRPGRA
jgi:hypothetical protein